MLKHQDNSSTVVRKKVLMGEDTVINSPIFDEPGTRVGRPSD